MICVILFLSLVMIFVSVVLLVLFSVFSGVCMLLVCRLVSL